MLAEAAAFGTIYKAEAHNDLIGHLLTFSHATTLLWRHGHADLFRRASYPVRLLIKILRASQRLGPDTPIRLSSPSDKEPLAEALPLAEDPLTGDYWQLDHARWGWHFGHSFKFPYSFYELADLAGAEPAAAVKPTFAKVLAGFP